MTSINKKEKGNFFFKYVSDYNKNYSSYKNYFQRINMFRNQLRSNNSDIEGIY